MYHKISGFFGFFHDRDGYTKAHIIMNGHQMVTPPVIPWKSYLVGRHVHIECIDGRVYEN